MTLVLLILALAMLCPTQLAGAETQDSYIREGTIGEPPSKELACPDDDFAYLPIECWLGERVIFLPMRRDIQSYGYQGFRPADDPYGDTASYDELVGKVATIVDVWEEGGLWRIRFQTGDGTEYVAATSLGWPPAPSVMGIAFLRDVDAARNKYLGETLWLRRGSLYTFDAPTEEYDSFHVGVFRPVEVVDIVVGTGSYRPVRFVLQDDSGREGLLDVSMSDTNIPSRLCRASAFSGAFLTYDPTLVHDWSDEVWSAVRTGDVFLGMTTEQARLSRGAPGDTFLISSGGRTLDWWVYPDDLDLYFENGLLVEVRNE